jgi:hypothetical protein
MLSRLSCPRAGQTNTFFIDKKVFKNPKKISTIVRRTRTHPKPLQGGE